VSPARQSSQTHFEFKCNCVIIYLHALWFLLPIIEVLGRNHHKVIILYLIGEVYK